MQTWVVMQWKNSFFGWNKSEYGGTDRVHCLPTEVWFPDIALYNNGDPKLPIAGGSSKFVSNVIVNDHGENFWSGPATFTATCDIDIEHWPFDDQKCDFEFGSFSYDSEQLTLITFNVKTYAPDGNSNWEIDRDIKVSVNETDRGNCCPYTFSQVKYSIKLTRLYSYQLFYIFAPCAILAILTLLSFWIPPESGERIGFVTTLLLSLMVFLLVVPESLPVSSEAIPVLGVIVMVTLVLISFVLLATIIVVACFFATGTPPSYLKFLRSKSVYSERPVP
ncbi:hypothetical protein QZH41_017619, partial [Actinostola sp. cb2023]